MDSFSGIGGVKSDSEYIKFIWGIGVPLSVCLFTCLFIFLFQRITKVSKNKNGSVFCCIFFVTYNIFNKR